MQVNPKGKNKGICRVMRSGSWDWDFGHSRCQITSRRRDLWMASSWRTGFRVVMGVTYASKS